MNQKFYHFLVRASLQIVYHLTKDVNGTDSSA